jgi:hypothetical protein
MIMIHDHDSNDTDFLVRIAPFPLVSFSKDFIEDVSNDCPSSSSTNSVTDACTFEFRVVGVIIEQIRVFTGVAARPLDRVVSIVPQNIMIRRPSRPHKVY